MNSLRKKPGAISFTIATKQSKAKHKKTAPRNKSKDVKGLYQEIYKITLKKQTEDIRRWKNLLCLWTVRNNIVKMAILTTSK